MFERLADEDFCYLTTTVRKSGKPHEIEIWFGIREGTLYLLSGGGDAAARELLDAKYMGWRVGRKLSSWARGALPVALDL